MLTDHSNGPVRSGNFGDAGGERCSTLDVVGVVLVELVLGELAQVQVVHPDRLPERLRHHHLIVLRGGCVLRLAVVPKTGHRAPE
ncbi:MAG TPA: hypothetical protein PLP26_03670 [Ilumatobacteraceae bacterium]|nr:hypothetical protein [Ilumatobacteraceae bacterium]